MFVSSATDGRVMVWNMADCAHVRATASATGGGAVGVTGDGAGGGIALTPPRPLGAPLLAVRCHQSGINALSCRPIGTPATAATTAAAPTTFHLVCSGGDDNSVAVCLLAVTMGGDDVRCLWQTSLAAGHASAVTAAVLLPAGIAFSLPDTHYLASVGSDQRFIVWRIHTPEVASLERAAGTTMVAGDDTAQPPLEGCVEFVSSTVVAVSDPLDMDVYCSR